MRPRISWSDLIGRKVGVWGLGVEGMANLRKLVALGVDPVLVDDASPGSQLAGRPVLDAAGGGLAALGRCEVVVKSPGISRYRDDVRALVRSGVEVVGGLGLWLEEVPGDRVAIVTGTKGKSTTVSLAGHMARSLGTPCFVGGNLGSLPYDPAAAATVDRWIVELSSYQATDLSCSPATVVVTSLHPDHLDWHGDAETYFADKLSACIQPGADLTVANGDDPLLRARADQLGPRVQWVTLADEGGTGWAGSLGLLGAHNRRNALMARACLEALGVPGAHDDDAVERAAAGFTGLESRLRVVHQVGGVEFVDDSLSTNVLPTMAALDAFSGRRVALLVGGFDRGIDYSGLAAHLADRCDPVLVVTLPDNGDRVQATLAAADLGPMIEVERGADLAEAVARAFEWAWPEGVVLLSPAAPSFGRFRDYRHRAQVFTSAATACGSAQQAGQHGEAAGGHSGPVAEEGGPVPGGEGRR